MARPLLLPYGRTPYLLDLGERTASVLAAAELPPPKPLESLLVEALAAPIGRPPVESMISGGRRVTVIVSDITRAEPRELFLRMLRERLPPQLDWTLAIATGTHGPTNVGALGIPDEWLRTMHVINHDGHDDRDLVTIGTTSRGTPVRLHRCVVETDLVIATGCVRPHYFAGFGAGVKAIFPGLGQATAIRINHKLKTADGARAGVVDENPCRRDLEEAVGLLGTPTFLLNGVCGPDGAIHGAVAGDPIAAFRRGADLARPWFTARAPKSSLVIASDALPITASLYQTAKIASAVAPIVAEGGRLILVAECADGIEPIETVNEAIFRIGVLPRLPASASLELLSGLPDDTVRRTLCTPTHAIDVRPNDSIVVVPRASQLIIEPTS